MNKLPPSQKGTKSARRPKPHLNWLSFLRTKRIAQKDHTTAQRAGMNLMNPITIRVSWLAVGPALIGAADMQPYESSTSVGRLSGRRDAARQSKIGKETDQKADEPGVVVEDA